MSEHTPGSTDTDSAARWRTDVEQPLSDNLIAISVMQQWDRALAFFDEGDTGKLADLLRSDVTLPMTHRTALADIIDGTRRTLRGKGGLKLDFDKRNRIALEVRRYHLNWRKLITREKKPSDYSLTPDEAKRLRAQWKRDAIQTLSKELQVSESAVLSHWQKCWARYRWLRQQAIKRTETRRLEQLAAKNRPW